MNFTWKDFVERFIRGDEQLQLLDDGLALDRFIVFGKELDDLCWSIFCNNWLIVSWCAVVGKE